jgi:predicted DNA-binding transcriptional regulator
MPTHAPTEPHIAVLQSYRERLLRELAEVERQLKDQIS